MRLRLSQNCSSPLGDAVAWLNKACSVWGWAPPLEQLLGQAWTPGLCLCVLTFSQCACDGQWSRLLFIEMVGNHRSHQLGSGNLTIYQCSFLITHSILITHRFLVSWGFNHILFCTACTPSTSIINAILTWVIVYYFWIFEAESIYAS